MLNSKEIFSNIIKKNECCATSHEDCILCHIQDLCISIYSNLDYTFLESRKKLRDETLHYIFNRMVDLIDE